MTDEQFQNWVDELNAVDMTDVCDAIGLDVVQIHKRKECLCPFHDDKTVGSCVITSKNFLYCHACHASANNIKLVQQVEGLRFWDAAIRVGEIGGIPTPENHRSTGAPGETTTTTVKQMPFAEGKEARNRQLELLGLIRNVSFFNPISFTNDPTERSAYTGTFEYDKDGYMLGEYCKVTLQQLYEADEIAFNSLVIGKLFEALLDLIVRYDTENFWQYEKVKIVHTEDDDDDNEPEPGYLIQKQVEADIELLLPLADYYKQVAPSYGYSLDFRPHYKKHPYGCAVG